MMGTDLVLVILGFGKLLNGNRLLKKVLKMRGQKFSFSQLRFQLLLVAIICIVFTSGCSDDDIITPPIPTVEDIELDVMSFNLRYDNPDDNENKWDNRKVACITMLEETSPSIIGTQEGLEHQIEFLEDNLPEYNYVGVGRDNGQTAGEFAAIFYKTEVFEVIKEGTFWLSETPDIPSIGWDAALERIVTWVHLQEKKTKKSVYTFNTHFDHEGEEARINSAKLMVGKVNEIVQDTTSAVFLTGDFNGILIQSMFEPILEEYQSAQQSASVTDDIKSFNGFGGGGFAGLISIDFVFHKENIEVLKFETINKDYGVPYISDHYPIVAKFKF